MSQGGRPTLEGRDAVTDAGEGSRGPLDPEVARRVAGLSLRARRAIDGVLSGMHRSPHRGASVVFVEHREYRPGDDPRLLDWRAYARSDRHSIKRFEQETQLRATLVVDHSGSMAYPRAGGAPDAPDGGPTKADHAATLLGALAYLLIRQGDAPGVAAFAEEVTAALGSRSRPAHLDPVLKLLASPPRVGRRTNLGKALTMVAERIGRRGVVAIASDLLDFNEDALAPLAHLVTLGHDVMVFHVLHPDELTFPFRGGTRFVGLEGELPVEIDADAIRAGYLTELERFLEEKRTTCIATGARYILARTDEAPEQTLAMALATRAARGL